MKVDVILTCFNRKEKTVNCVKALLKNSAELRFVIVDDNSSDGTADALEKIECSKTLLRGSGNLYWAGGMRIGINHVLHAEARADYVLLVNDDVEFYEKIVDKMIEQSQKKNGAVIVGSCCDANGKLTYGAIKFNNVFTRPMCYLLSTQEADIAAEAFNCNAVLMPFGTMITAGNFDAAYSHSLADYDYGFTLKKMGFCIYGTPFFVGVCCHNSLEGTWRDRSLSRRKRLRLKETPKGLPQKEWNHFLLKNLGLGFFLRYAYSAKARIWLGL